MKIYCPWQFVPPRQTDRTVGAEKKYSFHKSLMFEEKFNMANNGPTVN